MKILGTIKNGIKGGRYGKGRGAQHNGIDLEAPIGTPIYAMFDGIVKRVVTRYDPSVPYKDYSSRYAGVPKSEYNAGNRIWIESNTKEGRILIKFFHLNDVSVKNG